LKAAHRLPGFDLLGVDVLPGGSPQGMLGSQFPSRSMQKTAFSRVPALWEFPTGWRHILGGLCKLAAAAFAPDGFCRSFSLSMPRLFPCNGEPRDEDKLVRSTGSAAQNSSGSRPQKGGLRGPSSSMAAAGRIEAQSLPRPHSGNPPEIKTRRIRSWSRKILEQGSPWR